jgi:hypothetical protein
MDKYIVFLKDNRAEIVTEQQDEETIWEASFSSGWNWRLLEKSGADIAVWALDEEDAIEKAKKRYRWSLFNSFELEQLHDALEKKLEGLEQNDLDDAFNRFPIERLLEELKEAMEQIEEEKKFDQKRFRKLGFERDLPF